MNRAEIEKLIGKEAFELLAKDVYTELKKRAIVDKVYTKEEVNNLFNGINKFNVKVVDTLPETGEPFTIYLIPAEKGKDKNIKEEYLYIEDKYELIGSTQIEPVKVFKSQKTSLEIADREIIDDYFKLNTDFTPKTGDLFLITTIIEEKEYEKSSYTYEETDWEAITGCVDADKVILREDITMAGNYTGVGNLTKAQNGTAKFATKGKSVHEAFLEIFTKTLQPGTPTQPAVSGFALSGAKAVEVGTKIASASFGTAVLSAGSYQYGPATGVKATSYTVDRIAAPSSFNKIGIATSASGTDDNGGAGFIIGDGAEENVVTSLAYKVTVAHNEGVVANNNVGGASNPPVKIAAGSKTQQTSAYTSFRKYFYGATKDKPAVDSAYVRGLTNSTTAYKAQTLTLTVPAGAVRVAIACIGTAKGVTKVLNESSMNADITTAFSKQVIPVEGANGYTAKDYNVWVFEPAVPFEQQAILKVTLG